MKLTDEAIRGAFRKHHEVYVRLRAWSIPSHITCWSRGWRAFEQGSFADFEWLYEHLRRHWQVFRRSGGQAWTAKQTFTNMMALSPQGRGISLCSLRDEDLKACWTILEAMKDIKPTKTPSVVALSKFLHFWNPALFVIVDDAVMWQGVLSRSWLNQPLKAERGRIAALYPKAKCATGLSCDLLSYLAVLTLSSKIAQMNRGITPAFVEYVRNNSDGLSIDFPLETYHAAAIEWLLLGVTEIPPLGVELGPV